MVALPTLLRNKKSSGKSGFCLPNNNMDVVYPFTRMWSAKAAAVKKRLPWGLCALTPGAKSGSKKQFLPHLSPLCCWYIICPAITKFLRHSTQNATLTAPKIALQYFKTN